MVFSASRAVICWKILHFLVGTLCVRTKKLSKRSDYSTGLLSGSLVCGCGWRNVWDCVSFAAQLWFLISVTSWKKIATAPAEAFEFQRPERSYTCTNVEKYQICFTETLVRILYMVTCDVFIKRKTSSCWQPWRTAGRTTPPRPPQPQFSAPFWHDDCCSD